MSNWPTRPVIYEINTWVWLTELSRRHAQPITLANVPESVWDALAGWNIDAVWLMGVWERSPEGRRIALTNEQLMARLRQTLPDLRPDDVIGSPFCVRRYEVDPHLGGREDWPAPARPWPAEVCGSSSTSCPTTSLPIIPGQPNIRSTLYRGARRIWRGRQQTGCVSGRQFSPAGATRTSPPGRRCCN